ncbi:hypothetical protein HJG54_04370 [Leptolyngbya sp. NK1-12]|uniref:Uncharacterized protein n=1 Tax=Leptolyngbya sp. NK1-12 TaxID=2547451 RepID=A0AA97APT0_9CYAN|nr:hypothetical protein [Leptolyngbya sp. NK1-12]WNZ22173.1 hypothetical protein HJG54_04370 [Leptolyngbya sp. NK1-12]
MRLSCYTQYYLRQFLYQYACCWHYPLFGVGLQSYLQEDINLRLQQLCPNHRELQGKLRELEKLIELHRKVDTTAFCARQNISQLEQRILWLLGLKFLALLPMLAVTVIPDHAASRFRFILDHNLYQGIRYTDQLYGRVIEFGADYNLPACHVLFSLSGHHTDVVLTVSKSCHEIWLNLRTPIYQEIYKPKYGIVQNAA